MASWTDFLKAQLHPASVCLLPGLWQGVAEFGGFGAAAGLLQREELREQALDRVRLAAEECDHLQVSAWFWLDATTHAALPGVAHWRDDGQWDKRVKTSTWSLTEGMPSSCRLHWLATESGMAYEKYGQRMDLVRSRCCSAGGCLRAVGLPAPGGRPRRLGPLLVGAAAGAAR